MAGRVISRANMAHIQEIYDRAKKLGARDAAAEGQAAKAGGVFDLIEQARSAIHSAISMGEAQDCWPYLEDILIDQQVIIIELGEVYYQTAYTFDAAGAIVLAPREQWVQVVEVWQPVEVAAAAQDTATANTAAADTATSAAEGGTATTMKREGGAALEAGADHVFALKAVTAASGVRELEIRVAWGYDAHGERFTPDTDFDIHNFPNPPVAYFHGFKADGKPAPRPIYIGKTVRRENRADGHYLIAPIGSGPEADRVWEAALKGEAFASPGTVPWLRRKEADGTLTYWPIAEISVWDGAPTRKQAHRASLAFPVLKALYAEAGLPLPALLGDTPEAAGDAAVGRAETVDAATVGHIIAAAVAAVVAR